MRYVETGWAGVERAPNSCNCSIVHVHCMILFLYTQTRLLMFGLDTVIVVPSVRVEWTLRFFLILPGNTLVYCLITLPECITNMVRSVISLVYVIFCGPQCVNHLETDTRVI